MKNNEQHGEFIGPCEARLVRALPGPIERVCERLTDSEKRVRMGAPHFGSPVELNPA